MAVVGSVASWVGSFALYGFGELIENSERQSYDIRKLTNLLAQSQQNAPAAPTAPAAPSFNYGAPVSPNYSAHRSLEDLIENSTRR